MGVHHYGQLIRVTIACLSHNYYKYLFTKHLAVSPNAIYNIIAQLFSLSFVVMKYKYCIGVRTYFEIYAKSNTNYNLFVI